MTPAGCSEFQRRRMLTRLIIRASNPAHPPAHARYLATLDTRQLESRLAILREQAGFFVPDLTRSEFEQRYFAGRAVG